MKPRKLSAGVLQLVEAALDDVAEPVEGAIYCHAQLAGLAYRGDGHHVARLHGFANIVRVMAAIRQQDAGRGRVVGHDRVEAQIVLSAPA